MTEISVIGLGQRGFNYMRWARLFDASVSFPAVCDRNRDRADYAARRYKAEETFYDDAEFFKKRRSDAVIVATQDRDHYGHCVRCIELGYRHILCEKPVSPDIAECEALDALAKERGVTIVVCHVLRYTKYYKKIKEIIKNGTIGELCDIEHIENIGYFHFAHSYVRGNWRREEETSPMLLAKCCHDFDLFRWLVDRPVVSVSSIGSLEHFKKENAPAGAAGRCADCPLKNCVYNAQNLYVRDPLWKCTFLRFDGSVITGKYLPTKKEKLEALRTGPYGRCVYACDNDVCDRQTVNVLFEGGVTVSHSVTAFSDRMMRLTKIYGTKGEISADDHTGKIRVRVFGGRNRTYRTKLLRGLGHVDGDANLIRGFLKLVRGESPDSADVTFLSETVESHRAAILADRSRKEGGKTYLLR